jgi:hypothetical protein
MKSPAPLDARTARRMLARMGENGKPPELGISRVNVGNESYLQIIDRHYVAELLGSDGGSSFKLVQGTYGAGKTHFLYCVRDLVGRREFLSSFVTLSPRECPLDKPLNVYRAVARHLELPGRDDGDRVRGVDDVLHHLVSDRLENEGAAEVKAWIDKTLARAPIDGHSFRSAVVGYLHAVCDGDRTGERTLGAWLRGDDVPAGQARKQGVFEVPGNDNGFVMLRSLVQVIARLGFAGVALLFDEAERRLSLGSPTLKSTREAMDHLRELVDLCGRSELPRTLILYAVTPAFIDRMLPEYPALQQRFGDPVQYMSDHNPRAPLIDLEALDLDPRKLLRQVGLRLAAVADVAYDWSCSARCRDANLTNLIETITSEQLEVSHRRLFVKLWIRLLDELRIGGERVASREEVEAVVRGEQAQLLEDDEVGPAVLTFFGRPVPDK